MPRFRADWVLPVTTRPMHRGWIAVDDGRIGGLGADEAEAIDLGSVALLPGLVNAHTHLELSYLRGRVARSESFIAWVRALLDLRRSQASDADAISAGVTRALGEARRSGTVLFGDVANSLVTVPPLAAAGASARVFLELLGFNAADPAARVHDARQAVMAAQPPGGRVRLSLAAHAPYSVSPALFTEIRADLDRSQDHVSSVHVSESPEETELLAQGCGPWRDLLAELGAWNPEWKAPGVSPVAYLDNLGFLDARVLAVHGVQCAGEDSRRLQALGVTVVSCPRSNQFVGVGAPPLESFYAMDVEVAFGTDSLASVDTLNLFDELAEARRLAPRVPAASLIRSATLVGARALGFGDEFGSLEPGRRAAALVVRLPEGVTDVEEYLVGGVEPTDVSWLAT